MYFVCIIFVKVVCYYDLNVLSMSVIVFQKSWIGGGWLGCGLSSFILDFWRKQINFAKTLSAFVYSSSR